MTCDLGLLQSRDGNPGAGPLVHFYDGCSIPGLCPRLLTSQVPGEASREGAKSGSADVSPYRLKSRNACPGMEGGSICISSHGPPNKLTLKEDGWSPAPHS